MTDSLKLVVAANLFCTLGMFGVIWVVQLVHYPLFDRVVREDFVRFEADHASRISLVVLPLMLGELVTSVWLWWLRRGSTEEQLWLAGLALVGVAWLATFLLSVPEHNRLAKGFDAAAHGRLVATNWVRTVAWTSHGVLALVAAGQLVRWPGGA